MRGIDWKMEEEYELTHARNHLKGEESLKNRSYPKKDKMMTEYATLIRELSGSEKPR